MYKFNILYEESTFTSLERHETATRCLDTSPNVSLRGFTAIWMFSRKPFEKTKSKKKKITEIIISECGRPALLLEENWKPSWIFPKNLRPKRRQVMRVYQEEVFKNRRLGLQMLHGIIIFYFSSHSDPFPRLAVHRNSALVFFLSLPLSKNVSQLTQKERTGCFRLAYNFSFGLLPSN